MWPVSQRSLFPAAPDRSVARAHVNGVDLEHEVTGDGEPLVFVGGSGLDGGTGIARGSRALAGATGLTSDLRGRGQWSSGVAFFGRPVPGETRRRFWIISGYSAS